MKEITRIMIKKYALQKLRYDFMGYDFTSQKQLSFHHLIVPKRLCRQEGLGDGYLEWNGAILRQTTSHDYLHTIEAHDRDMFVAITNQMIKENEQGYLDLKNIYAIYDVLNQFEKEYCGKYTKKGHLIIKEEYTKRILRR